MTYFHESRLANLPSILRGIASDEQIRTVFDLQAMNEAADEIERLRRWQTDANSLLNAWYDLAEEVYEAMGKPPAFLGRSRVDLIRHALNQPPIMEPPGDLSAGDVYELLHAALMRAGSDHAARELKFWHDQANYWMSQYSNVIGEC